MDGEADYDVRVSLSVRVRRITDERAAIQWALELVNADVWRTLEGEGFTIEAHAERVTRHEATP